MGFPDITCLGDVKIQTNKNNKNNRLCNVVNEFELRGDLRGLSCKFAPAVVIEAILVAGWQATGQSDGNKWVACLISSQLAQACSPEVRRVPREQEAKERAQRVEAHAIRAQESKFNSKDRMILPHP